MKIFKLEEMRKQAKEDFIKLARKIYQDKDKELANFEKTYHEYNKAKILWWYTMNSPICALVNNCLRISSSDSILYCRLILKDLEIAIREQYQLKSKDFSGVVYRGAYILKEEWERLERNIGQEIEMYGFLSTAKNQKIAQRFLNGDLENKVFIKILIPPLPELDEQGFAEISEFSRFPKEEEILFNVRSRFRILEAGFTKIGGLECRHLVLFYGAHLLRRHLTENKSSIKIELELPPEIECHLCGSKDKLFGFKQEETSVSCLACLIKISMPKDTPMIALEGENEKRIERTLPGKILISKDKITFADSGYKCHSCEAKGKDKYYKWMSCDGKDILVQCEECLETKRTMENKILVSEGSPYAMWQEEQKTWETVSSDYQGIISQRIEAENQGHVEMEVENYDRCVEYGKKVIDQFKHQRRKENFKFDSFSLFGEALMSSGKYQEALRYFTNFTGFLRFIGEEKGSDGVLFYCKSAAIHFSLGDHEKALKFYEQALQIQISVFGENHKGAITPYNGLASLYEQLCEHEKAFEYFIKAINIQKSISGENHPMLAILYSNLASHYRSLGKYKEGLKYFNIAHHITKSIYGKRYLDTAVSYSGLALFYQYLGNFEKAKKCYWKALDIQKSIRGTNHPDIAVSYNNLAAIYKRLGRHQEALEYFNMTLDIQRSIYGEKHSGIAHSFNSLGDVYQSIGDYQKALQYFQKALTLRKSIYGEKHPEVGVSYNNIAVIHKFLGNYQTALEHLQNALEIQKDFYSEPHPGTAT